MKKLLLALLVSTSPLAFAQQTTIASKPIVFGAKAGMNLSSISKQTLTFDQNSKVGFNAGIFANIPIEGSFSVQPELLYSQYGDRYEYKDIFDNSSPRYGYTRNLSYITLPVMLQYNALPKLYVEAGPEFGFLIGAKNKATNESSKARVQNGNYKDQIETFNFGIGIGAGYYFTPNLGVTARYVAGLTGIFKNDQFGTDKARNNVFQIGLAYKFN